MWVSGPSTIKLIGFGWTVDDCQGVHCTRKMFCVEEWELLKPLFSTLQYVVHLAQPYILILSMISWNWVSVHESKSERFLLKSVLPWEPVLTKSQDPSQLFWIPTYRTRRTFWIISLMNIGPPLRFSYVTFNTSYPSPVLTVSGDCQGHSHPRLPMPDPSLCL